MRVARVFVSVIVTDARGTAAPLGSVTAPERALLVPLCARIKHGLTMVNTHRNVKLNTHARTARTSTSGWILLLAAGVIREGNRQANLGLPKYIRYT